MKKEPIEELVARIREDLEEMEKGSQRVVVDVGELQDRLHRKGSKILWQEAEVVEAMRTELLAWIIRVGTGEVEL